MNGDLSCQPFQQGMSTDSLCSDPSHHDAHPHAMPMSHILVVMQLVLYVKSIALAIHAVAPSPQMR